MTATASADTRIGGGEGPQAGAFTNPNGLAVNAAEDGDIYVTDTAESQRIDQFKPDGEFVRAFGWGVLNGAPELQTCTAATGCQPGQEGSGPGQLDWADEIAVDNDPASLSYGDVYVVDQRNFRVEKYGPEGKFLLMFGGGVDHTTGADVCTATDLATDTCGAGVPGTEPAHFYQEGSSTTWDGSVPSWGTQGSNSIAVGPGGTVYVGDHGRIQEFGPDGAFTGELELPDTEPRFVSALAVDSAGDVFERSVDYAGGEIAGQVPGIREYSPAHALLRTFDAGLEEAGSEPTHIALDQAGDLFAADHGGGKFRFRAFKPTGALYAEFTSDQLRGEFLNDPRGIAVGAADLYATTFEPEGVHVAVVPLPQPGPPLVSGEQLTDIEPTTATLGAVVDPEQFDTTYQFQWITEAAFLADGESFGAGTESAPEPPADLGPVSREDLVQAPISALTPATTYRWRVVATSVRNGGETVDGPTGTFETLPNVSVRDFTTQTVGPELVVLKAELDPNNGGTTHYTVHYGKAAGDYSAGSVEGTLKKVGSEFEPIAATLTGLEPDTTYHYQLTASNSNGPVATADAQFTTEETVAEEDAAAGCANALLREENDSLALPDCRAYEQVSPVFKGGAAVSQEGLLLSPGGDGAAFRSLGIFGGATASQVINPYLVQRTAAGWLTRSPFQSPEAGFADAAVTEYSAELDRWLVAAVQGATAQEVQEGTGTQEAYYTGDALTGSFTRSTPILAPPSGAREFTPDPVIAQSTDLSRLFIGAGRRLLPAAQDPVPDSKPAEHRSRIYEVSGAGGPSPTVRLVAEVPSGLQDAPGPESCELDTFLNHENVFNSSSEDGSTLFYTAPLELSPHADCENFHAQLRGPNPGAVLARTGTAPAVQLSAESPTQCTSGHPCAGARVTNATFDGASPDGRLAWFTTAQPLIDSDTDAGSDLYLARLEDGELTELVQASAGQATPTHPTPGQDAGVQGVLEVSPDGTHAAFVAAGALTTQPNSTGDSAIAGADNLYVYDADTGTTKFVARLCSGPEESGSVDDPACAASLGREPTNSDRGLWGSGFNAPEVQFTPDGQDLLFAGWGRLTPGDTDATRDVYRYDFATGGLVRVSLGHRGNDADGNDDAYSDSINSYALGGAAGMLDLGAGDSARSLAADGSVAIFTTTAPLVSRDTNGAPDLYEWEESGHGACHEPGGCVSLVSDGVDPHGTEAGVISSSGRDVAFTTSAGLVPADTDGLSDLYDAREGGGFPPPRTDPCHEFSAHCPGPESPQPASPKITTPEFVGPGNEKLQLECGKGRRRVKKHGHLRCVAKKHHKVRHHRRARRQHKPVGHHAGGGK